MTNHSPSVLIEILNSPAAMVLVGSIITGILGLLGILLKDHGQLELEKNREEVKKKIKKEECLESLYWFSKEMQELYYSVFQEMFHICFFIKSFFEGCHNKSKVEIDRKYQSLQTSNFAAAKESFDKIFKIIEPKQREFISSCNFILNAEEVSNISSLLKQSYAQYSHYAEKTCELQVHACSIILDSEAMCKNTIDNALKSELLVNLRPSHVKSISNFKHNFSSISEIISKKIQEAQGGADA